MLKAGDRVGAAVSGGADSVALLRLLLELREEVGLVLSVVHFNHKLRGAESDADAEFVAQLAESFRLEFHQASEDVAAEAAANGLSIEAAAREMRYEFFYGLQEDDSSGSKKLDKVATAHTLDDQAETVLLRAIRGTGTRGLGGIHSVLLLEEDEGSTGEVIRPMLGIRRREVESFLREIGQNWREDSSNRETKFTRNRVRHLLMPLLERDFNPSAAATLSELADIARAEEDYWNNEVAGWMGTAIHWTEPKWAARGQQGLVQLRPVDVTLQHRLNQPGPLVMNASVDLMWLLSEPLAVQRRAIKAVGDTAGFPLEFRHVEEVLRFASDDENTGKRLSLPLGWELMREADSLMFLTPDLRTHERVPPEYEYKLPLPGRAIVPEVGIVIEAVLTKPATEIADCDLDRLLDASAVSKELVVRNWRPGDRFWPEHTKSEKKIKELLQEQHITGSAKKLWPVVSSGEEIVWVRGFRRPASAKPTNPGEGVLIRETPLEEE
jgi:tRNA(Ile)-lysidine synthase